MPDNENPTSPSGETEAQPTLREIAESAYDEIVEAQEEPAVDTGGRARDEYGRFARAEPGEAEARPEPPSPEQNEAPSAERPTQPQQGVAAGPPENWSQADKDVWHRSPPDIQAWAIRRNSEMEGDYQRKVQATAAAAQFAHSVAPVFEDPRIRASIQQAGLTAPQVVREWGQFHLRAISPNIVERAGLILDLAQRCGVPLNPAAFSQQQSSPSGLPPEVAKDPAIKYFADYLNQISGEVQAVKAKTGQMEYASRQQQEAEALKVTKWGIDQFADAKDQQGNPLHPDFDLVIDDIQLLYAADPKMDLAVAYEKACGMNQNVMQRRMQRAVEQQVKYLSDQRAAQAVRSNVRGRTAPVANGAAHMNGPRSLRETIEAEAEALGM